MWTRPRGSPLPPGRPRPLHGDAALTEILGSVLIVGITVALMAAFMLVILLNKPGPVDQDHTDLAVTLDPGAGGWGTGDETVLLRHGGGEALPSSAVVVSFLVGGTAYTCQGADLGGPFDDGSFTIGEVWSSDDACEPGLLIPPGTSVAVDVIRTGGDAQVVATGSASAGRVDCSTDAAAPTVSLWGQSPSDVTATTIGEVVVNVVVVDGCSGVDQAVDPALEYRLSTDPSFTSTGPMTRTGTSRWEGTIPDLGWTAAFGATLEYRLTGMADRAGNAGDSDMRQDAIGLSGTITFVSAAPGPRTGTITAFAAAQSDSDGDAEMRIQENSTGAAATTATYAASAVVSAGSWSNGGNAYASDDAYATTTSNGETIRFGIADPASLPAQVLSVTLRAEVSVCKTMPTCTPSGSVDDGFNLRACTGAACSSFTGRLGASQTDTTVEQNVTSLKAPWTLADLQALEGEIKADKSASIDGTWRIDHVFVEVKYRAAATYATSVELRFDAVPAGILRVVEIEHRVIGDTFRVEGYDAVAGAWSATPLGTLTAGTSTVWSVELPAQFYDALTSEVRIRIVDAAPTGSVRGELFVEHARVVTGA